MKDCVFRLGSCSLLKKRQCERLSLIKLENTFPTHFQPQQLKCPHNGHKPKIHLQVQL